ncbi:hypothetical protein C4585_03140 [Candidatus Parcubacteria bacterium]|nr:MAG: hypothetical protein C4585_03140 [Candidatus Parcubacteria bacterium]
MKKEEVAMLALRIGVAFAFLFPAVNAWIDPNAWIGYFPVFVKGYVPDEILLHLFGVVEIIIAVWILSGWRIFLPSAAATAMLLGIVIFNPAEFQILFRDLAIAAMSFALAVNSYKNSL